MPHKPFLLYTMYSSKYDNNSTAIFSTELSYSLLQQNLQYHNIGQQQQLQHIYTFYMGFWKQLLSHQHTVLQLYGQNCQSNVAPQCNCVGVVILSYEVQSTALFSSVCIYLALLEIVCKATFLGPSHPLASGEPNPMQSKWCISLIPKPHNVEGRSGNETGSRTNGTLW